MARAHMKFDGTVLVEPGAVLRGELRNEWADGAPRIIVALLFGSYEVAEWDVTDRQDEWAEKLGDYWDAEDREQAFVEKFLAEKLAPVFGGLEGVIKR